MSNRQYPIIIGHLGEGRSDKCIVAAKKDIGVTVLICRLKDGAKRRCGEDVAAVEIQSPERYRRDAVLPERIPTGIHRRTAEDFRRMGGNRMRKVEHYICEVCGTEYKDYARNAKGCTSRG